MDTAPVPEASGSVGDPAARARPRRSRGLLERLDDRLSPILVKEVRQALRGNVFKFAFWFTLVAATILGVAAIFITTGERQFDEVGPIFFTAIFCCMAVAIQFLVPFTAFTSMGAEWEENTYDLLVLSNLRPRHIVGGKLLSAAVQTLLFFSAFGPFLVFAFLLRGVDLTVILYLLALSLVASLTSSVLALALSSLTRHRFLRILFMAALAGVLGFGTLLTIAWAIQIIQFPQALQDPDAHAFVTAQFLGIPILGVLAFATACSRLAHEEENRSSGLRLLATGCLVAGLVWMAYANRIVLDGDFLSGAGIGLLVAAALGAVVFTTEPEPLGRRTRLLVPRRPALALLAAPFLPGGARGLLLFLIHGGMVVAGAFLIHWTGPGVGQPLRREGGLSLAVLLLYTVVYVGLPSAVLTQLTSDLRGRVVARAAILGLFLAGLFGPWILGNMLQDRELMKMSHPGNPAWLMDEVWDHPPMVHETAMIVVLLAAAGLALLLNLRRVSFLNSFKSNLFFTNVILFRTFLI